MKTIIIYFLSLTSVLFFSCSTENKTRKTLFIGIDGLIWKAINEEDAPFLTEFMAHSWVNTHALAEVPTWSSNGWSALLTGVSMEKHGYYINNELVENTNLHRYPSFFRHLKEEYPHLRTASFVSWGTINEKIVQGAATVNKKGDDNGAEGYDMKDKYIYEEAMLEIQRKNVASVIFLHFDQVDGAGHKTGFDITHPDYRRAVSQVDDYLWKLIRTVKARPEYEKEDWLFVVVTDHGGTSTGHGGDSYEERNAFIILNNRAINPQRMPSDNPPYLYHVPPTIFSFMEFPIRKEYDWDGESLVHF